MISMKKTRITKFRRELSDLMKDIKENTKSKIIRITKEKGILGNADEIHYAFDSNFDLDYRLAYCDKKGNYDEASVIGPGTIKIEIESERRELRNKIFKFVKNYNAELWHQGPSCVCPHCGSNHANYFAIYPKSKRKKLIAFGYFGDPDYHCDHGWWE